jgi:hypothetical protein
VIYWLGSTQQISTVSSSLSDRHVISDGNPLLVRGDTPATFLSPLPRAVSSARLIKTTGSELERCRIRIRLSISSDIRIDATTKYLADQRTPQNNRGNAPMSIIGNKIAFLLNNRLMSVGGGKKKSGGLCGSGGFLKGERQYLRENCKKCFGFVSFIFCFPRKGLEPGTFYSMTVE